MRELKEASEHLMFVSGVVYRILHREARRLGLRWTALMVLKDLDLMGSANQQTLADIEQVRKPTMTVLLQKMEEDGWIIRSPGPTSGRIKLVKMTTRGRKELRAAGAKLSERLQQLLADMPKDDLAVLKSALVPLVNHLTISLKSDANGD